MRWHLAMAGTSLWIAALLAPAAAAGQDEVPEGEAAGTARLGLLSQADRLVLRPHLARGPVALVEFSEETDLPGIVFAVEVSAPAARIAEVIGDPDGYPRFMPALDRVQVRSRRGAMVAYGWTWRTAMFTLQGEAVMTRYPPPQGRRDRPWRIEVRNTGGDLGTGRQVWRVYPEGPNRSLVVLSTRIDLRDANYVTRQIGRQRSINRTSNMSLAYVMLTGVRDEARRRAGVPIETPAGELPPLRRPEVDIFALRSLLFRGDLVLFDTSGTRLDQVAVLGRLASPIEPVRAVLTDPRAFGPALVPGSYARVTHEVPGTVDFEWGIDIPLIGTSGTMRMIERGERVTVDATGGALAGGRWHFDTPVYDWGEACVLTWGRFDPGDANWLLRMLVDGTPAFGHGIQAGSEVMVVRAIRSRARDLLEEQRARERAARQTQMEEARRAREERAQAVAAERGSILARLRDQRALERIRLHRARQAATRAGATYPDAGRGHTLTR